MPELTVSDHIFDTKPDSFIKEHISHLLVQQFSKSLKTEISHGIAAFSFYFDHSLIIVSSKQGQIYYYQQIPYSLMIPDSFLQTLSLHTALLPSHWQRWFGESKLDLIRRELSQSLNFNRLNVQSSMYNNIYLWNWKISKDTTFTMNNCFVFDGILT